jgi:hypothetical protein
LPTIPPRAGSAVGPRPQLEQHAAVLAHQRPRGLRAGVGDRHRHRDGIRWAFRSARPSPQRRAERRPAGKQRSRSASRCDVPSPDRTRAAGTLPKALRAGWKAPSAMARPTSHREAAFNQPYSVGVIPSAAPETGHCHSERRPKARRRGIAILPVEGRAPRSGRERFLASAPAALRSE